MAQTYKWQFKARFRRGAYGWRGTKPAAQRLKEAVSELDVSEALRYLMTAAEKLNLLKK